MQSDSTQIQTVGGSKVKDMFIDFTAGVNGGIVTVYTGQSLDTVKVKMQAFPSRYTNMFSCFWETFRKDGIRGLYAGTTPSLAANIAENSVLFAYYGLGQKTVAYMFGKKVSEMTPLENALAGSNAAIFSSLVLCPTELIKCRLQALREVREAANARVEDGAQHVSRVEKMGPIGVIRAIWKQDGVRGFFRGLAPTFGREVPGYFCFFGGYEAARYLLTPPGMKKEDIGHFRTGLAGGIGGVALWVVIFPFDVAKSKLQIAQTSLGDALTLRGVLRNTVRQDGFLALYNGLLPTVIRTFPATGALFIAVENTKKYMHVFLD